MDSSIIPYLFLMTFIVVLLYAALQYRSARRAQREHHHSASAEAHPEPQTAPATRGAAPDRRSE